MIGGAPNQVRIPSRSPRHSVWYAGRLVTVLTTTEETEGRFSLVEEYAWKDSLDLPVRVQTRELVCVYVVAGELAVHCDEDMTRLTPGTCIVIPAGVPYHFEVMSDSTHLIQMYAPGGFEGFFRDLVEPAESPTRPTAPVAPLNIERLVSIAAKYGLEIVAAGPDAT